VLVAGVERDERGDIEAAVRGAFGRRDPAEAWSVSLVRLGGTWSVTLRGPGERFRNLSFTAEEHRLAEAVAEAIGGDGEGPAPESRPADSPARVPAQASLTCEHCRQSIRVTYEAQPDEAKEEAPLACPHCWAMNRVEVGAWAAVGGDYRAEKA
jgi:hypothetical protein